ncbi:MAG: TIGR02677 family protein [Acidimicrobiales bacterium]
MRSGARSWRRFPADLFRFTTTDLRDLHIAVLAAFDEAAVVQPALRFDDVRHGLAAVGWDEPLDDDRLDHALQSLVGWGLLDRTQDHTAHYATPEEFERRNLQWSLTAQGQAAIGGVLHALDALRRAVSLQPAVLDAIADGLVELRRLLAPPPTGEVPASGAAQVTTTLAAVEGHVESLVSSVRQFNTHLQRLLREDATADEVFLDVKRRTVTYLEDYISGVERPSRRVALAIERLRHDVGIAVLHDRALAGANLAPLGGEDPAPGWLDERARRWSALVTWFAPESGDAKIASLVGIGRQAIIQLLRVLERRFEARRRSASVGQDFKRLADWFAGAAGEDEAHALFDAAFGLWPARHAHLVRDDEDALPSGVSWFEAPPVAVAPALRTSTTLTNRGQARPVGDPAAVRARRQREQAEALARHHQLRGALATVGSEPLSAFGVLDAEAFAELLGLLSDALSAVPAGDGTRRALSADGQVEIVLAPAPRRAPPVRLVTGAGALTSPDFRVRIALLGDAAGAGVGPVREASGG